MQSKIDLQETPAYSAKPFESLSSELDCVLSEVDAETGTTKARRIADKLVALALNDNLAAIKEVFDRIDGKAERGGASSAGSEGPRVGRNLGEIIGPNDDEIVVEP